MRDFSRIWRAAACLGVAAISIATWSAPGRAAPAAGAREASRERILEAYANLPLAFVENRGQADARVRYYAQGPRYAFYLTDEGIVLAMAKGSDAPIVAATTTTTEPARGVAVALRFVGANKQAVAEGAERAGGTVSYLRGNDPARWHTELPQYGEIVYRELWPGIDLRLHGQAGMLKYEFRVRPGARIADIQLAYAGAAGLTLDDAGGLLIRTELGVLSDAPPVSYQEIAGRRIPVASHYTLNDGDGAGYGFVVGAGYEPDHELIIDPSLGYSTFLGGTSHDYGAGIAVDAAGNAYVVGWTQSTDFPTTAGAFDRTLAGPTDVTVSKLNPTGTALLYSTYIGGFPTPLRGGGSDPFEFGRAIAVDAAGNAYVTGQTTSSDFPTTKGAFQRTLHVSQFDATDAFVLKLSPTGGLVYSTFLGGTDLDDALGIAVDSAGNAYVTGETGSADFPTTVGAFDRTPNGSFDAFVTKLNPTGTGVIYSTYLGGAQVEFGQRVAVDSTGSAYVMGQTSSPDFPTTAGAFATVAKGGFDVFVTKLKPDGSGLVYSTFLGGSDTDDGGGLAIDASGNAYVSGGTLSADFPTTPGAFATAIKGSDAFVTKINPAGSALVYSTFLGGTGGEGATALALDPAGNAWVTGGTSSADFPTTPDGFDTVFHNGILTAGAADVFVTELNSTGSALLYSTFLGGTNPDFGNDIALDSAGNIYVTGETQSAEFPITPGAFDKVFKGDPEIFQGDAFVTKLAQGASAPTTALSSVAVNPASVVGGNPATGTVTLTAAAPTGGISAALSSSTPAAASVPASVMVPAGATSATFAVTSKAVATSTVVTITASAASVTRTALLTITPGAQSPTLTLTVTATGRSGEGVTSSPAGINVAVGSSMSAPFAAGKAVTLTVSNGRSATWTGACSSGGSKTKSCTFTPTANGSVTANVQ